MVFGPSAMRTETSLSSRCRSRSKLTPRSSSGRMEAAVIAATPAPGAAQERCGGADGDGEPDQDDAEAECQREVALGDLERDRRGHDAGHMVDVAADDHHRADLGDGAAEAREHGGQQAVAAIPEQRRQRAPRRRAERAELLLVLAPQVLDHLAGEGRDDGRHQQHLGDHHGGRREEQAEHAERAGAREHQVDHEAHHHRRQAHERIEQDDDRAPAGKAEERHRRAQRQADRARHRHGADADLEREEHDLAQVAVEVVDEGEGRREGLGDIGHAGACRPLW